MDSAVVIAAQNKLAQDVQALVDAFIAENAGVTLETLNYDRFPMEEGKNVRCSVSFQDTEGAQVTRTL